MCGRHSASCFLDWLPVASATSHRSTALSASLHWLAVASAHLAAVGFVCVAGLAQCACLNWPLSVRKASVKASLSPV